MKNKFFTFLISMLLIFLAGCGGKDENASLEEFYDIKVETQDFPDFRSIFESDEMDHSLSCLGTQFLKEEPVQLWADTNERTRIYLCRMNGEMELLLEAQNVYTIYYKVQGVAEEVTELTDELKDLAKYYHWYLNQEGGFYCIGKFIDFKEAFIRLDGQGTKLYSINQDSLPGEIKGICQTQEGRVYIELLGVSGKIGLTLAEVNPVDGSLSILEDVQVDAAGNYSDYMALGSGTAGPAVFGDLGIRQINPENGELTDILQFKNTSYTPYSGRNGAKYRYVTDFRIKDDGNIEMLQTDDYGSACLVRLKPEKIDRILITICAPVLSEWIKLPITQFNQENDTYFIKVEEFGADYDMSQAAYEEALNDFTNRINIQIATGKGPDILIGTELLEDGILDMIEKGAIEDLAPYMERSGIREEDYFSLAFDWMRKGDSIYTICPFTNIYVQEADRRILGSEPDIRELADTLLVLEEKAVYMEGISAGELLHLFLEGSETLWGMVDWEAETCDFKGALFADLLEAAEKYGDASRNAYKSLAVKRNISDFYLAASPSEMIERGLTQVGWMFDDGCHLMARPTSPVVINANSEHKEAAWEFLCFLLKKDVQENAGGLLPVNREAFWGGWLEQEFDRISPSRFVTVNQTNPVSGEWENIALYMKDDREFLETEKLPNFVQMLEDARYLPARTQPLLDIICEEAESYFSGTKSKEEIIAIIENRIRLYMSEHSE